MNRLIMGAVLAVSFVFPLMTTAAEDATENQVRQVVLDYIESYYEGDAERMHGALHPRLSKRHLAYHPMWGGPDLREMSAMTLVDGVRAGWGTRTPEEQRVAEVEILDISGDMASAKLTAASFHDYLHLQRVGDEWKIVNVLWSYNPPAVSDAIRAAVAHPERPEGDADLDVLRRPAEVLAFAGIEAGMTVADLMAGTGWYTELLSRTVGPDGTVYMQNNAFVIERFAEKGVQKRLAGDRLGNVVRHDSELDDLGIEPETLDAAVMVLFYHDTYWQGVDRETMNRGILAALKPGGIFLVVDHHAEAGSGDRDVETVHRGDARQIQREILKAGFTFAGSSPVLRHPEDDRTMNVFNPEIRRKTDRFVYRFQKPGAR